MVNQLCLLLMTDVKSTLFIVYDRCYCHIILKPMMLLADVTALWFDGQ